MRKWRFNQKTILLGLLSILILGPAIALAVLWFNLPSVEGLHARAQPPTTKILDRHGRLLYEIIDPRVGHHTPLPMSKIPLKLQQATIAVEDANFYSNPGVDIIGIMRALWINIRGGEALAGGSTITQQLARLLLLDSEERTQRTLLRKLRESLLAWQIAQRYSKDEVLGLYLNETYYGNLAYGVEAAARAYFGKPATDLDLAECALLAGLPQSPSNYDPFNDPLLAKKRQAIVLGLMQRNAFINEDDMLIAKQSPLSYAPAQFDIRAPHFVSYVRRWLEQEYGTERLVRGSLIVTTTLDLGLNDAGTEIMRTHLRDLAEPAPNAPSHNANNAALIAIDPHTGEILSMIGSPGYFDAKISGAVNAAISLRQPGSAIKPITYAAAFARLPNFTAATPLFDVRTAFPTREGVPYVPVNYDRRHHGPVSVRAALATSNNVAAVSVLHQIGLPTMIDQGHAMGLSTFGDASQYGLALTLGGGEVRLLDLTAAFGVFAAQGQRVEPIAVREVRTVGGIVLFRGKTTDHRPPTTVDTPLSVVGGRSSVVVSPQIAWLITDILSDNNARAAAFGESSMLRLSRPAAAKTGTTSDWRDNWTVGYTPDLDEVHHDGRAVQRKDRDGHRWGADASDPLTCEQPVDGGSTHRAIGVGMGGGQRAERRRAETKQVRIAECDNISRARSVHDEGHLPDDVTPPDLGQDVLLAVCMCDHAKPTRGDQVQAVGRVAFTHDRLAGGDEHGLQRLADEGPGVRRQRAEHAVLAHQRFELAAVGIGCSHRTTRLLPRLARREAPLRARPGVVRRGQAPRAGGFGTCGYRGRRPSRRWWQSRWRCAARRRESRAHRSSYPAPLG